MGSDQAIPEAEIKSLPTVRRQFRDFARTNPYVKVTPNDPIQTAISIAGKNNRYNSIQIDGAVNNDLFGLAATGTPGGQTDTQPISLDTIQEIQVAVSPYDVKQGRLHKAGSPYTAVTGADENRDGFFNDRPAINGLHFTRNQFRQPDFYQLDFRLAKTFHVGPFGSTLGQVGLTAIVECFNCTNTANRFVTNFTWGTGQTPSSTFGIANGVTTLPRTLQFAGRIDF
jgi:hypothetical protein